jgi:hypothetical protein
MSAEGDADDVWDADEFDAAPTAYINPRATRKVPALSLDDLDDPAPATVRGGALVGLTDKQSALAFPEDTSRTPTVVIPGTGVLRAHPFIKRRPRSLTLRIAAVCLIVVIALTGVFTVTPLAGSASQAFTSFESLSGAANAGGTIGFIWYTAQSGDTPQSITSSHHVQLGGFYELNNMTAGQEIVIGQLYKVPTDPNFGSDYQPPSLLNVGATNYGNVRFGPNWWDSIAGSPLGGPCAPNGGNGNYLGYKLHAPNWGAYWVRGFIVYGTWVYHTGVDLAAPQGNVIHAAQAGQVIWAGYDATNGLGWSVKIDHCNHVSTVYGHMLRILVQAGDFVDVGSPIGLEGSTGNSTGPHLHFQIEWNNVPVDPLLFYGKSQYNIIHNAPPIASPTPSTTATPGGTPTAGGTPTS